VWNSWSSNFAFFSSNFNKKKGEREGDLVKLAHFKMENGSQLRVWFTM
jgi:hypothetical protein